ncbi:hypothetical protein KP509_32G049500 [Ceratopteris richardii]|uniref:FYVE zinc finger domain-containing protein n=1 Tax=Ceratopteris richardii TaxID=49495 RepID=A0A8T2QV93_CERRI|nr:hypothetical protein KP509_32G049500 [Ceratopteris richardii]
MLEKIGLPPKPSLKGNEWVLDATHCQGCSSAFTFFNRKRMCLRGQGSEPVRICNPCKKLEDAARLESRLGHRYKNSKGSSKSSSTADTDPTLQEILGHDLSIDNVEELSLMPDVSKLIERRHVGSTSLGEHFNAVNDDLVNSEVTPELLHQQAQEQKQQWLALKKEGKSDEALRAFKRSKELQRQAEDLKLARRKSEKKVLATKKGKSAEVNSAEQMQSALIIVPKDAQVGVNEALPQSKSRKAVLKKENNEKDDLMDALKELGWNEQDVRDNESKSKTVETELSELAAAIHPGNVNNHKKSVSSMEVLAHKRKALALKREGQLTEAKEELKKAKLLEKQLEEQELLGGEEYESDDDLRALMSEVNKEGGNFKGNVMDMDFSFLNNIHEDDDEFDVSDADIDDPEIRVALQSVGWEEEAAKMDHAGQKILTKPTYTRNARKPQSTFEHLIGGFQTDLDEVETTEDDMKDPYFLSTLKAMGFEEDAASNLMHHTSDTVEDKENLQKEILSTKREALALKRAGKLKEAKEKLQWAKQLEKELEVKSKDNDDDVFHTFTVQQQPTHGTEVKTIPLFPVSGEDTENVDVTEEDLKDPELAKALKDLGWQEGLETGDNSPVLVIKSFEEEFQESHKHKSKSELQKQLLGIKRAALKLRREGKSEEAENELKKAHILEQLMDESARVSTALKSTDHEFLEANVKCSDKDPVVQVSYTINFFHEKEILDSSLPGRNMEQANTLGTGKEINDSIGEESCQASKVGINFDYQLNETDTKFVDTGTKSRTELNEEHTQECNADGLLGKHVITSDSEQNMPEGKGDFLSTMAVQAQSRSTSKLRTTFTHSEEQLKGSELFSGEPSRNVEDLVLPSESSFLAVPPKHASQHDILSLKRQALALKREGRQQEAKEKLKEAKLLEKMLLSNSESSHEEEAVLSAPMSTRVEPSLSSLTSAGSSSSTITSTPARKFAGKDRMKLQQESLAHKRKALALRREGKTEAAELELEVAKALEKQMEELDEHFTVPQTDNLALVDDFLDPELLAALKGLGWKENDIHPKTSETKPENVEKVQEVNHRKTKEVAASSISGLLQTSEREQLEQSIKSEKIRALQLKRSGQQAEALEVLKGAKLLEKRLQSLV